MIIVVYKEGNYELTSFELTNRYDWNNVLFLDKYSPEGVLSAVYFEGKQKKYYVKRFNVETNTMNKKFMFISQEKGSKLEYCSYKSGEIISFKYFSNKKLKPSEIELDSFIDVKGWKSIGNKIPIDFQPFTSMNESISISVGFNFLLEKYLNEIVSPSL